MKIFLIQSFVNKETHPIMPLGLLYLCRQLEGHDIKIFDPNIYREPIPALKNRLELFKPEIVGISIRNIDSAQSYMPFPYVLYNKEILETIVRFSPGSKIIAGGAGFKIFPKEIMKLYPQIDVGMLSEAVLEDVLKEKNLCGVPGICYREGSTIVCNKSANHDSPIYFNLDYGKIESLKSYDFLRGIGIRTKVGCSYNCKYCTYNKIEGRELKLGRPEEVVSEIKLLKEKFNIQNFFFTDCLFNNPRSHSEEILKRLLREGLRIRWGAYFAIQNFTRDYYKLCLESGCKYFEFSPDAIDNKILETLGKGIVVKDILKIYKIFKRKPGDVILIFNYFLNAPGENIFSIMKTIFILFYHKFHGYSGGFTNIRIYPNADFFELVKDDFRENENFLLPVFYNPKPYNLYSSAFDKLTKVLSYKNARGFPKKRMTLSKNEHAF